jgi:hypothetical protein
MFISKNKYISRFNKRHNHPSTFDSFKKHARVKLSNGSYRYLNEYSKQIQQILYQITVIMKDTILTNFYNRSLNVNSNLITGSSTKSPMKLNELSNMKEPQYKNIIRNLHYIGILKNTNSDLPNLRPYLCVLEDLYKHWIIDYKMVTPSAIHYFSNNQIGSVLSSFYFRASIMNPYLVYSILSKFSPNTSIFTPTLGWSSYLLGASKLPNLKRYTGIDILPKVCKKTKKLADTIAPTTETTIICSRSETLSKNKTFRKAHRAKYDIVYFSPPYYKLEQYEDVMDTYTSFDDWYNKYWVPTINLCWHVLKKNGKLMFILSLYGIHKNNLSQMITAVKMKDIKYRKYPIRNNQSDINANTDNTEYLYVFEKK